MGIFRVFSCLSWTEVFFVEACLFRGSFRGPFRGRLRLSWFLDLQSFRPYFLGLQVQFDVETVYIFSWAVAFTHLGWVGRLRMSFFIVVLFISLIYIWKKGGLDWGPVARKKMEL
jgi:hypothetical protein